MAKRISGYIGTSFGRPGRAPSRKGQPRRSGIRLFSAPARHRLPQNAVPKGPPMVSLIQILLLILDVVWFIMIAHIIMSWLINFNVLNLGQDIVRSIWYGLNNLLEPIYAPIRRFLPPMGGLDLAPLVALIAVYALRIILINNAGAFM
jgi:YggT family protein